MRDKSGGDLVHASKRRKAGSTGRFNSDRFWTHYRLLTKVESPQVRDFYEIEAVQNH